MKMTPKTIVSIAGVSIAAVVAAAVLGGSFYTIDQGDRGVILRNGAVIGTAEPGLGFKLPVIDSVKEISIQTQARMFKDVLVYSKDQQTATLLVSVNFRLSPDQVEKIYSEFGGLDGIVSRVLDRQVPEEVKNVFGRFVASVAIQERERLGAEIQAAIIKATAGFPLVVESVQLENIDFSDAYEKSIEQRMIAEIEVQKIQQIAEREKVQAEILVIQAKADSDATRLRGDAEAHAINARGKALRDNPSLVELVAAEKWNGVLPTTMVPGSAVPFVNVK
jgi:regulator of protease activity HflC (stomatin/prohibitin superfamily)